MSLISSMFKPVEISSEELFHGAAIDKVYNAMADTQVAMADLYRSQIKDAKRLDYEDALALLQSDIKDDELKSAARKVVAKRWGIASA